MRRAFAALAVVLLVAPSTVGLAGGADAAPTTHTATAPSSTTSSPTAHIQLPVPHAAGGVHETPTATAGVADSARATAAGSVIGTEDAIRLTLDGPDRFAYATPSTSIATAIAAGDDGLDRRYTHLTFEKSLSSADDSERALVVRNRLEAIQDEIERLRATERRATEAYANGRISETEFVRVLAETTMESENVARSLDAVEGLVASDSNVVFLNRLRTRLDTFDSPIRNRLVETVDGSATVRVSVRASTDGYLLGLIADGTYYREILRFDYRDPTGQKAIESASQAIERAEVLYPVNRTQSFVGRGSQFFSEGAYFSRFSLRFPTSETLAYIDAGTGNVFFEQKRHSLAGLDTFEAVNATSNESVRLVVERYYPVGPALVRVEDAETGEPIDAAITVDGKSMGRTGPDGELWVLEPPRTYVVNVMDDGIVANATVGGS